MANPSVSIQTHLVTGMTCEHCVLSVREEVSEVAGVEEVAVDLASGQMVVVGSGFSTEDIQAAVAAAGYASTPRDQHT